MHRKNIVPRAGTKKVIQEYMLKRTIDKSKWKSKSGSSNPWGDGREKKKKTEISHRGVGGNGRTRL